MFPLRSNDFTGSSLISLRFPNLVGIQTIGHAPELCIHFLWCFLLLGGTNPVVVGCGNVLDGLLNADVQLLRFIIFFGAIQGCFAGYMSHKMTFRFTFYNAVVCLRSVVAVQNDCWHSRDRTSFILFGKFLLKFLPGFPILKKLKMIEIDLEPWTHEP